MTQHQQPPLQDNHGVADSREPAKEDADSPEPAMKNADSPESATKSADTKEPAKEGGPMLGVLGGPKA